MNDIWILAQAPGAENSSGVSSEPVTMEQSQTATPPDPNAAGESGGPRGFGQMQWILIILMFLMMYLLIFRGPRKKQQEHKKMVSTLQKNDKVRTIGGIIGTVVDIKDDEITLKVDESNNTKIKITPSAIGTNISEIDKK
ncbi:preprotein translocase subunit YajC [Planctomycetota bacterium]